MESTREVLLDAVGVGGLERDVVDDEPRVKASSYSNSKASWLCHQHALEV